MVTPRQQAIVANTKLLAVLKNSVETIKSIPETQVREYHTILDKIKRETEIDFTGCRVTDSDIQQVLLSFDSFKGERNFSKEKFAPKLLFVDKINRALKALEAGLTAKA